MKANFIVYVKDQKAATEFYEKVLELEPQLNVPGMTEFKLAQDTILGLMPVSGIKQLLGEKLPNPDLPIPRAEIYLTVDDPQSYHQRALKSGAVELSPLQQRNWGDYAAYSLDPDQHVLVFASS